MALVANVFLVLRLSSPRSCFIDLPGVWSRKLGRVLSGSSRYKIYDRPTVNKDINLSLVMWPMYSPWPVLSHQVRGMLLNIETKSTQDAFRPTTWSIHVVWCFWMGRRLLDSLPIRWQDGCPGMVFWAKSLWSLAGPIVCKSYKMCVYDPVEEDVACCASGRVRVALFAVVFWHLDVQYTELVSRIYTVLVTSKPTKYTFHHTWWRIRACRLLACNMWKQYRIILRNTELISLVFIPILLP